METNQRRDTDILHTRRMPPGYSSELSPSAQLEDSGSLSELGSLPRGTNFSRRGGFQKGTHLIFRSENSFSSERRTALGQPTATGVTEPAAGRGLRERRGWPGGPSC